MLSNILELLQNNENHPNKGDFGKKRVNPF